MRRSSQEIADEILRRAEMLDKRDARRKRRIYTALSVAACLAVVVGLSFLIPSVVTDTVPIDEGALYSAAMFAGGAMGGYVLIGVIGLLLGAAVMFFYMRKSGKD